MERRLSVLLGFVALGVVFVAPASSGDGIKMRQVRGVCNPSCIGDRQPTWSPDGRTIAFIRRTRNEFPRTIFTVRADGGAARRVTKPKRTAPIPDVLAWSPDSTRLAFHTIEGTNYVVRASGGDPVPIRVPSTTGTHSFDGPPSWSPDGSRIAFVRQGPFNRYGPPPWCCQLWVAAADGSAATLVGGGPPPAAWLSEPAWSPDGRLAYVTGPRRSDGLPDLDRAEIWVSAADGSGAVRLVGDQSDAGFHQLTWSTDGSRLAFITALTRFWDVRWVSSDGARQGPVGWIERDPMWTECCSLAPDAGRAVYTARGADGAMEVRLVENVKPPRRIADGISSQSFSWLTTASWSPDGERVTYVSDGECPTELAVHTVRVDAKDVRRLTRPCRIVGTHGPNRLRGTRRTDALYGRGGNDRLEASRRPDFLQGGLGRDILFGGLGDDRLYGGPGRDWIEGGDGWDAVYSRDGAADVVRCGSGRDTVRADTSDRIARDCELVERE